jgi:hypothetical protein
MDILYLKEMLEGLQSSEDSIRSTGEYCCHQRSSAAQVIQEIENTMAKAERDKRILFLHLLNEILMRSDDKNV